MNFTSLCNAQYVLLAALAATIVFAGLAVWQTHVAKMSAEEKEAQTKIAKAEKQRADEWAGIAESRRLAVLSDSVRPRRLDQAMLLAYEASRIDTPEARGTVQRRSMRARRFFASSMSPRAM